MQHALDLLIAWNVVGQFPPIDPSPQSCLDANFFQGADYPREEAWRLSLVD